MQSSSSSIVSGTGFVIRRCLLSFLQLFRTRKEIINRKRLFQKSMVIWIRCGVLILFNNSFIHIPSLVIVRMSGDMPLAKSMVGDAQRVIRLMAHNYIIIAIIIHHCAAFVNRWRLFVHFAQLFQPIFRDFSTVKNMIIFAGCLEKRKIARESGE